MPVVTVEMDGEKLERYNSGKPVTVTKPAAFTVWTNHPNAANSSYRSPGTKQDWDGEWIVPQESYASNATEVAQNRLNTLGNCPENTPVLLKVKSKQPFSSPVYFSGVILKDGQRILTRLDI